MQFVVYDPFACCPEFKGNNSGNSEFERKGMLKLGYVEQDLTQSPHELALSTGLYAR